MSFLPLRGADIRGDNNQYTKNGQDFLDILEHFYIYLILASNHSNHCNNHKTQKKICKPYCVSKKYKWPILSSNLLYKMGCYFPSNQVAHPMRIFPHSRCASDVHPKIKEFNLIVRISDEKYLIWKKCTAKLIFTSLSWYFTSLWMYSNIYITCVRKFNFWPWEYVKRIWEGIEKRQIYQSPFHVFLISSMAPVLNIFLMV